MELFSTSLLASFEALETALKQGILVPSALALQTLAAYWARSLPQGTALALSGPLGSGKTTFVQGFAHGLGIDPPVGSPTFNLYQVYHSTGGHPAKSLVHIDAYRLTHPCHTHGLYLHDCSPPGAFIAAEWPQNLDWDAVPHERLHHLVLAAQPTGHTLQWVGSGSLH
jgi:tRNA threonylcarbamoyladenosine biosynthesis protein TsaE